MADGERSPEEIQRDIERSRVALAQAVDQIAERTNPKRLADEAKQTLRDKAQSPAGRAVIGAGGGLVVVLVVLRIRKARSNSRARKPAKGKTRKK